MAVYGSKEFNEILNKFKGGRQWLQDIVVEIVDGENNLDPLTLLRAYDAEPTLDNSIALTCQMVLNKEVKFFRNGEEIYSFVYRGGDLGNCFAKAPYLFDTLIKLCYGLLVKKLTPPSADSEIEDRR